MKFLLVRTIRFGSYFKLFSNQAPIPTGYIFNLVTNWSKPLLLSPHRHINLFHILSEVVICLAYRASSSVIDKNRDFFSFYQAPESQKLAPNRYK